MLVTFASGSLRGLRVRAILMVAFALGGRWCREIAGLSQQDLTVELPIVAEGGSSTVLEFMLTRQTAVMI